MNFSKGKISNVNKKLLAGSLALIMIGTPLTGCSDEKFNTFGYTVNEQGQYEVNGVIDYELLKNYYFLVIENSNYNITEFYIVSKHSSWRSIYYTYNDIFNGQEIKTSDNREILFSDRVENYLYATNNIKANYTKEDVEQILEGMKENYLNENNKQLVREK